jgi:hypothetical protein
MTTPAGGGGGGLEITIRDIYDALMRLTGQVQASLSTGENLKRTADDHEQRLRIVEGGAGAGVEVARDVADHEGRLRAVENWQRALPLTALISVAALGTALAGALWGK